MGGYLGGRPGQGQKMQGAGRGQGQARARKASRPVVFRHKARPHPIPKVQRATWLCVAEERLATFAHLHKNHQLGNAEQDCCARP